MTSLEALDVTMAQLFQTMDDPETSNAAKMAALAKITQMLDASDQERHLQSPLQGADQTLAYLNMRLSRGEKAGGIAAQAGVHRATLYRWMKRAGVERFHSLEHAALDALITQIVPTTEKGRNWGYRMVQRSLRSEGYRVPERQVLAALHRIDHDAVVMRSLNRFRRGQYSITEPMKLWHTDCKLI
jgi:DNA-binding phage protein